MRRPRLAPTARSVVDVTSGSSRPARRRVACARMRRMAFLLGPAVAIAAGYVQTVRGALTLDLLIGRRVRPLGPIVISIAAPPETVFDVVSAAYLGRTPRAMRTTRRSAA